MRLPDTIIEYVESEIVRCRTVVDLEQMIENIVARFPGVDFDREQVTAMVVDRAGARGLAIRFAT